MTDCTNGHGAGFQHSPAPMAHLKGGTAIFTMNESVHQVAAKSGDGMGRWSSTLIRGTQNRAVRIISAYRCVKNTQGPLSVWNQQRYLLDLRRCSMDPINKFDYDIKIFLEKCLNAGELIILGIDANEDVRTGSFSQLMLTLGLINICTTKHGMYAPPTYARGTLPIYALFVSSAFVGLECGYLPVVSDHRILWMDVPHAIAFGRKFANLPTHKPQRLIFQDPRVVKRYVDILQKFLQEHKIMDKANDLRNAMQLEGCNPAMTQRYDAIDDIHLKGILLANKKCRHIKMGQVPFSPALVIAWNHIKACQLVKKNLSGDRVSSRYLIRALKSANMKLSPTMTVSDANDLLTNAWAMYKILKKQATSLRSTWLEEVAAARSKEGKITLAQELSNLKLREKHRREGWQIKFVLKPTTHKGLSNIEVQNQSGHWEEITKQEEIKRVLLRELSQRFNQASETSFQTEPLLSWIGNLGISPTSEQILQGVLRPPPTLDEWAAKLIPFLKQVLSTADPIDLTPEQYAASWKRVKEKTSAGPSGLTIPHIKAHGISHLITKVDTIMANLPYRYGFSLKRSRKGLDVMLEKKPGVRQLSKLRAILLYEADFNQNNKRLGREMLFRAEDGNAVAVEQFGSRKHMSATDQSLNKALTFDIWRQLRQQGALGSNDAKACYDRIVHNCASLCMQRVGMRKEPIISLFETIQKLEHHVRTVFGESKIGFVQQGPKPLQGVGQGNGAGPQIWALVSTPVLNMLRAEGLGAKFQSTLSKISTTLVGFAFVDDTDLVTSGSRMELNEVISRIQHALTAWEG
jgi:hypothetical protein